METSEVEKEILLFINIASKTKCNNLNDIENENLKLDTIINLIKVTNISKYVKDKWIEFIMKIYKKPFLRQRYNVYSLYNIKNEDLKINEYKISDKLIKLIMENLQFDRRNEFLELIIDIYNNNPNHQSYIIDYLISNYIKIDKLFNKIEPSLDVMKYALIQNNKDLFFKCIEHKIIPNEKYFKFVFNRCNSNLDYFLKIFNSFDIKPIISDINHLYIKTAQLSNSNIINVKIIMKYIEVKSIDDFMTLINKFTPRDWQKILDLCVINGMKIDENVAKRLSKEKISLKLSNYIIKYSDSTINYFFQNECFPYDFKFECTEETFNKIFQLKKSAKYIGKFLVNFLNQHPNVVIKNKNILTKNKWPSYVKKKLEKHINNTDLENKIEIDVYTDCISEIRLNTFPNHYIRN
tara:strand:- start:45104 stop:46327 length:1224 start_codon:yes stop_codon:yes gene_type:complete